ncbi:S-layer homology domain-containing protein [Paenibacillus cremeus]|uniref:S-layer homology domain-containing protein n=1 Tax=Paenibacillus cremeus TaxID=2163881 RepID=A0A559KE55_9BACL|nr:S-layer homology domain-containing protein [Paenibacillus cremeus]TVY10415.1 S-layer homology domain-containing protein [Paenibacillus cremeus]
MNSRRKRLMLASRSHFELQWFKIAALVTMTIVSQSSMLAGEALAAAAAPAVASVSVSSSPLSQVQGLNSLERNKLYEGITFNTAGWQIGTIVSKEPYAVVTAFDEKGPIVRVWTGVLVREGSDLETNWDELRVSTAGKVLLHVTDLDATIPGYFASPSKDMFKSKAYLGAYPWADIPTDPEAEKAGSDKVTSNIALHVYGNISMDKSEVVSTNLGPIKKEAAIPDTVPALKRFGEIAVPKLPVDATTHWAKDEILDLMKKSIIEGYDDHTIRPDRTLSRAEFLTLLVKTLGLSAAGKGTITGEELGYIDLNTHWALPAIEEAQQFGLLDKKPASFKFEPDAPMSRIEMIGLLGRVLQKYGAAGSGASEAPGFSDTGSLTEASKAALQAVVGAGIVGGYPDGTFRPDGKLTRAEAFKVISRLFQL